MANNDMKKQYADSIARSQALRSGNTNTTTKLTSREGKPTTFGLTQREGRLITEGKELPEDGTQIFGS